MNFTSTREYLVQVYNSSSELANGIKIPIYVLSIIHGIIRICMKLLMIPLALILGVILLGYLINKNFQPLFMSFNGINYDPYFLLKIIILGIIILNLINWYISGIIYLIAYAKTNHNSINYIEIIGTTIKASIKILSLYIMIYTRSESFLGVICKLKPAAHN